MPQGSWAFASLCIHAHLRTWMSHLRVGLHPWGGSLFMLGFTVGASSVRVGEGLTMCVWRGGASSIDCLIIGSIAPTVPHGLTALVLVGTSNRLQWVWNCFKSTHFQQLLNDSSACFLHLVRDPVHVKAYETLSLAAIQFRPGCLRVQKTCAWDHVLQQLKKALLASEEHRWVWNYACLFRKRPQWEFCWSLQNLICKPREEKVHVGWLYVFGT